MNRTVLFAVSIGLLLSACGGGAAETKRDDDKLADDWEAKMEAKEKTQSAEATPIAPADRISSGELHRADVLPVVANGVGHFLQHVQMRASMKKGKFIGFEIVSFFPDNAAYQKIDLVPGDIVTSINGMKIERPEHAVQVLDSLRTAIELNVDYLRGEEARKLHFTIVDD